jgi:hypothetical protein
VPIRTDGAWPVSKGFHLDLHAVLTFGRYQPARFPALQHPTEGEHTDGGDEGLRSLTSILTGLYANHYNTPPFVLVPATGIGPVPPSCRDGTLPLS